VLRRNVMDLLDMIPECGPDGKPLGKKERWIHVGQMPKLEEIDDSTTDTMLLEFRAILKDGRKVTWASGR
jgi:hypothetical protein